MVEHGWKPMPTSMKVLFVLVIIGILGGVNQMLSSGISSPDFYSKDSLVLIFISVFSLLADIIFLVALWKRHKWTAKYGMIYFIFIIAAIILVMVSINEITDTIYSSGQLTSPEEAQIFSIMMIIGLSLGIAFCLLFIILIWRARKYFEQP